MVVGPLERLSIDDLASRTVITRGYLCGTNGK